MSTTQPQAVAPEAPARHRSPWMWVSLLLLVLAGVLLIWALTLKSDRDSAQQDAKDLQAQLDQSKETGGTVLAAAKVAITSLTDQLGATNEDVAALEQDLQQAKDAGAQAEQDIATARDDAAAAGNDAKKQAQAEVDGAKAQAAAAESKARIAADCAKSYVSAFGTLFEGDSVRAQAAAVRSQLQGITADCKTALAG